MHTLCYLHIPQNVEYVNQRSTIVNLSDLSDAIKILDNIPCQRHFDATRTNFITNYILWSAVVVMRL